MPLRCPGCRRLRCRAALNQAHRALRLAVGGEEGAADILAHHPQDHRLHARHQQDHGHGGGPARGRVAVLNSASMIVATAPIAPSAAIATPAKIASRSGASEKLVARFSHSRTSRVRRVVGAALRARQMPHLDAVDPLRHLHDQAVDVRIGAAIAGHRAHHQRRHAAERGQIQPSWLVQQPVGHPVGEPAAQVAPAGVLLGGIARVDHVPVAQPGMVVQAHDLLGRVLQVVVHGDDVSARA